MSLILGDGFDHVDTEHRFTDDGVSVIDTSPVRTGTHSRQLNTGGVGPYHAFDPQEDDTIYVGFGFNHSTTIQDSAHTMLIFSEASDLATGHIGLVRRPSIRGWEVRRGVTVSNPAAGTQLISVTPNVWFPESWHYIELGAKIHDTTGWVELRQDGVTIGRFDGDTRNGGTDGLIDLVAFNQRTNGGSFNIDDVYIINEQGTHANTWLGDVRVYPSYPNAPGNYSQLVGSDGNSVDNYLLVDEAGTPDTTDYVGSSTDGDQDSYTFQDLPVTVGTIIAVEVRMHAAKDDTGTKQIRSLTRRAGTDSFGADKVLAAIPLYQTHTEILELDPITGAAWTISNFNATEFGVEVRP